MKKVLVLVLLLVGSVAFADVYVHGYYKSNGTYVAPHHRSNPDGYSYNNYSTKGNTNPYTGNVGTQNSTYGSRSSYSNYGYSGSKSRSYDYGY